MKKLGLMIAVMALLQVSSLALAQSGGGYDLSWSTVDGGGGTFSEGGGYSLGGTVGQPDAGLLAARGFVYLPKARHFSEAFPPAFEGNGVDHHPVLGEGIGRGRFPVFGDEGHVGP